MNKELQQQLISAGYKGDFTLDSLIEALGGDYHEFILRWRMDYWWADCYIGDYKNSFNESDYQKGTTPEEAVAKLLLSRGI